MIVIPASHVDHVDQNIVHYVLERFKDRSVFFAETFDLPECVGTIENGLYGPSCGDAPVAESEVFYESRAPRTYVSRMTNRPKRQTRQCTVIAGPHDGQFVLYTVFGGPMAPPELADPIGGGESTSDKSKAFWSVHALAK